MTDEQASDDKKRPVGRPSKYKPEYCKQVIEWGKQGYSREMIAGELDVSWNTLLSWMEAHPEFLEALESAKMQEMIYFEKIGIQYMVERPQGDKLNTSIWSRSLAARFPQKYRENTKIEVTGKNDGAIQVDVVHDFAQELMNDLLSTRQAGDKSDDS
jgi:transposase-like protein